MNKSEKTQARLDVIKLLIEAHQGNIDELQLCLDGNKVTVSGPYPRRIDKPGYIPIWARQFHWTIKNLTDQINELEKERAILIEYGA